MEWYKIEQREELEPINLDIVSTKEIFEFFDELSKYNLRSKKFYNLEIIVNNHKSYDIISAILKQWKYDVQQYEKNIQVLKFCDWVKECFVLTEKDLKWIGYKKPDYSISSEVFINEYKNWKNSK